MTARETFEYLHGWGCSANKGQSQTQRDPRAFSQGQPRDVRSGLSIWCFGHIWSTMAELEHIMKQSPPWATILMPLTHPRGLGPLGSDVTPRCSSPAWNFGLRFLVCFNKWEIQGPETSGHLFKVTQQVKARVRWDVPSVSPLVVLGHAGPHAAWLPLGHHIEWSNPDCQVSPSSSSQPCSIGARQVTERTNPWSLVTQLEG